MLTCDPQACRVARDGKMKVKCLTHFDKICKLANESEVKSGMTKVFKVLISNQVLSNYCAFTLVNSCRAHCMLDDFAVLGSL